MKLTLALLCAILQVISAAQVEIKPRGVEIKPRVSDDNAVDWDKPLFIHPLSFFSAIYPKPY